MSGSFFAQFLDDYFAESEEHLATLRRALLEIEEGRRGRLDGALRDLSRALHTLKGLAGMVGFGEIEVVAHHLEGLLRAHGAPAVAPQGEVLDALFSGSSLLEECIGARRAGGVRPDVDETLHLLRAFGNSPSSAPPHGPVGDDAQVGLSEATEAPAWEFEFVPTPALAQRGVGVEAVRSRLEQFGTVIGASPVVMDGGGVVFRFRVTAPEGATPSDLWRQDGIRWEEPSTQEPPAEPAQAPDGVTLAADTPAPRLSANLVRVDLSRLDELMRLLGELVISRGRLDEGLRGAAFGRPESIAALQDVNALMERQLRDLRGALLRVRLVEVGEVFERLRFAVREVARELGREVEVVLKGESTEVDKLVVERMLEPLLHLARNAVSHGIEPPDQRVARGKPLAGRLTFAASTAGERIVIEVEDDGAGIDLAHVESRARAAGLLGADQSVERADLLDVLCAPGFSTREQADLASGRGVGMAVVRSTTEELGGELYIETVVGKGTSFRIELPLTLMIIDAVLIRLADQVMAVPQPALLEVLTIEPSAVVRFENNEAVRYRGGALPLVRLRDLFGLSGDGERGAPVVLVVGTRAQPLGLVVDRVLGLREIVVRSLSDPLLSVPGIAGATELGDGRVVLILDAAALARARRGWDSSPELRRSVGAD